MKIAFNKFTLVSICCCFLFTVNTIAVPFPLQGDSSNSIGSKLPVIGIGYGAMTFIGSVGNTGFNQPFLYRGGLQLDVQLHSKTNYEVFFNLLAGKVYGEEKSATRNLNFMSNVLMEGINLRYSFNNRKNPKQTLTPFVSLGVNILTFNPYTDLKDANGNTYYYWNDGTIRNMAETGSDAAQSKILHRDYTYETNIHDANVDSVGSFKEYALAFPLSVGVKFRISGRVSLYFTETYHFTTTHYIDGGIGNSSANLINDKILYSSVSFHYDLSAQRETPKPVRVHVDQSIYNDVNYNELQNADGDGDGVPDFLDEDNSTPPGVKVDAHGRAIDTDGDGVPDYRDKELNSAPGALVDEYGVTITDSTQEAKYLRDSMDLELTKLAERIRTKNEPDAANVNGGKNQLPDEFKIVDSDHDGVISADEIAKAIEFYTTGKSPFTKVQFYRLIDYFFSQ